MDYLERLKPEIEAVFGEHLPPDVMTLSDFHHKHTRY